jgi:glycosyltransferase involved in cell wall biosynthesis
LPAPLNSKPPNGEDEADGHAPAPHPAASERPPLKVLIIIPTLWVGGAETDVVRNLSRIDRTRFEITVCTFLDRGPLAQQLLEAGINVIGPFQGHGSGWLRFLRQLGRQVGRWMPRWRPISTLGTWLQRGIDHLISSVQVATASLVLYRTCVRAIANHVRREKIDITHAILPYSYLFGVWASHLAGQKPVIMSRLSMNWYHEQTPMLGLIERRILHPRVAVAICNTEVIARELQAEGVPKGKIRVVYNGIDLAKHAERSIDRRGARSQLHVGQADIVFSSVGNLFTYKGHDDLLHALHKINEQLPSAWTLLAVGRDIDGNLARLDELAASLGLAPHVHFLGERLDVPVILSAADIHVSASHTEGFPNNILEAMCSRLPVVATAVGGVPELVVDGVTGTLVPPRDADALGRALLALAKDGERRAHMGRAGYERVKMEFSIERSVTALEDIYRAAAKGDGRSPAA